MYNTINKVPNSYVDFDKVKNIQIIAEKNETEVCVIDESFQNTKQQELENWKSNNVYVKVAKSDQPLLN